MKIQHAILGTCLAGLLAACGGGGDAAAPTATAPSFPLRSAYSAQVAGAFNKSLMLSGTCGGTGSVAKTAAVAGASFEGVSGRLSEVLTLTVNITTGCAPASATTKLTSYYDAAYTPLGSASDGNYGVYLVPASIPASVVVGDAGIIGTSTSYTDSTKKVAAGRDVLSYVVEADAASAAGAGSTAILNLVTKSFNAANVLTSTAQFRNRIGATGALTLVSIDIQESGGSAVRIILQ